MAYNFMIISDDYQATETKLEEIKKGYQMEDRITYQLLEENLYALIDELSTVSLFGDPKFVVVKGAEELLSRTDQAFMELIKNMNDHESNNVLVLVFDEKVDYANPQFQKLKRCSTLFEIQTKNINLNEYAQKQFSKDGYQVDEQTLQLLIGYVDNLSKLQNAIDLLESYRLEEKIIIAEDVHQMICEPLEENVYTLIEAVLSNNKKLMLKGYQDLKLRSIQASNLIAMLINKFQELYNVSVLVQNGFTQAKIQELFNVSSGRAYYMIKNTKDTSLKEIIRQLELLNQLDYKIKSGKIDQNLGLELYFLN